MVRVGCITPLLYRVPIKFLSRPLISARGSKFRPIKHCRASFSAKRSQCRHFLLPQRADLCTAALCSLESSAPTKPNLSYKAKKKALRDSPEMVLKVKLDICSRNNDVIEALRLYDAARSNEVKLNTYHYNCLLYLCSSSASKENDAKESSDLGHKKGFDIFRQMVADKVVPNEATFTNAARLAVAINDPEMAFDMVKQMRAFGIQPKLRSYGPALLGFCNMGNEEKAYEVDAHMVDSDVLAEEPELSALLKVSVDKKKPDKVYEMLQRMRATVRQVSESTFATIEDWFESKEAGKIAIEKWDLKKVRQGVVRGGGGWHGQGWLGSGKWKVVRTHMDEKGVCNSCGEKLVCIDIDPMETEKFAMSLTELACQKEVKAHFNQFQEWLAKHGPFDAVVDGANVGLINQQNLNFFQLNNVVIRCQHISPSKRLPLVILHRNRVTGGPAQVPKNKNLLEKWREAGALYATPQGSNDDWHWLYAAVSCKCLLVTNDEMRDHLFQLLGNSFFPRWKEKHQVRLSVSRESGLRLLMPPPYSIVIQESEKGSWHVPMAEEDDVPMAEEDDDLQRSRRWLCATRAQ